ncbi:MAG: hypothetical protein RSA64_07235, partial [Christensenellaceae bacterium]
ASRRGKAKWAGKWQKTGSPLDLNEVGQEGGEERPPKRRSFCPLGQNKQKGRESDERAGK